MPADGVVTAKFHGGRMKGAPTFQVVHSAETPLRDSYVASIADFFRRGPAAGTSAHHMVGPRTWLQLLPEDVVAYAAGPKANPRGVHWEQPGYARFKRAEWTTPDGLAQINRLGGGIRESCERWSIPKRWCTDAQLRAAAAGQVGAGGLCTHAQVARVLGGTTHTDPEPNFPGDLLLGAVLTDGGLNMELTGKSMELLADVQKRVRGFDPNADMLQMTRQAAEGAWKMLAGDDPAGKGDRLGHLWNQGGEILAAVHLVNGKVDALTAQLEQVLSRLPG